MLRSLLARLGLASGNTPRNTPEFDRVAELYLNLVKSRIIGAIVVREERIVPDELPPDAKFGLVAALSAYFTARTDAELEARGVAESVRVRLASQIPELVLDEMGFSGGQMAVTRQLILQQAGLFRGVIAERGSADVAAVVKTISVLMSGGLQSNGVSPALLGKELDEPPIARLLARYERYLPQLDKLALLSRGGH